MSKFEYQEELRKLHINLANAGKTFGVLSLQYQAIESMISDFVAKYRLLLNPLPSFENLAIRSRNAGGGS